MTNKKIKLTMNMLFNYETFFEKLNTLKENEDKEIAVVSFQKDLDNKFHAHLNIDEEAEVLLYDFIDSIESIMEKLLNIIDFTNYEDTIKPNKEYVLANFYISPIKENLEITFTLEDFALPYIITDEFKDIAGEFFNLLDAIENKCEIMFNQYILNKDTENIKEEITTLKPIQYIEDVEDLMFVIEGKDFNLYKADSNLDEIKNAFINCPTVKGLEEKLNYKYIGLTSGDDIENVDAIVITYNNKLIIENEAVVGKCIFPIKMSDLSNMISELVNHYRNLGYEIIVRN